VTDPVALFLGFLKAAALSIGGQGALPILRQEFVATGILTEHQVLEALAISRIAPGPTGLYVVSLGYFAAGIAGAAIATVAAALPPLSMVVLAGVIRRWLLTPWAAGIVRGIVLATSGLVIATSITLLAPDRAVLGVPAWQIAVAVVSAAVIVRGRTHPGLVLAGGAAAGLILGR